SSLPAKWRRRWPPTPSRSTAAMATLPIFSSSGSTATSGSARSTKEPATSSASSSPEAWRRHRMPVPIDFYFDFSSPYGYLPSTQIDALAARHGRSVAWRPFLLGAAFKLTGQRALTEQPLRGDYARRDFARSARLLKLPFILPQPFPFFALAASRAFYWLQDP